MLKKVKNTTLINPLDLVAPHSCRGCGRLGEVLCERCKKYIVCCNFNYNGDKFAGLPEVFMIGAREGLLGGLIHDYKYYSVRAMGAKLAEMMCEKLPSNLPDNTFIVPLPTSTRHIRERGFDHTLLLAKKIARLGGFKVLRLLIRNKNTVQVGADKKTRLKQAEQAYEVDMRARLDPKATYVLFDDVWTTGASMRAAYQLLRTAGAKKIIIALLAVSEIE
jgi:ComF family protein